MRQELERALKAIESACKRIDELKAENKTLKEGLVQPEQEPVGKLQEPTAERAWFTIAELNAWADKKLSENPHWVMPKDEPERDEAPSQRTWVGLTMQDVKVIQDNAPSIQMAIFMAEATLKDKNHGNS